jgi:ABC-2 type transport system ATP-binding protein
VSKCRVIVQGLVKRYGGKVAVNGLSFIVEPGEIYALLGPNGAGKTTTLKTIVGLLKPDAGYVSVCGVDVHVDRANALRYIGYVPENPVGFDYLRVREFFEFVGSLRGIPRDVLSERVERLLSVFQLERYEDYFMGELSRGSIQKVLVISALIHEPSVLVLDEPMSGMDPESQISFKNLLKQLARGGAAILISSHMLDAVERFATKVGIISDGKMIAEGTLDELKRRVEVGGDATLERVFLRVLKGV